MSTAKPKLIVILGPTASGKTELALALAKKFGSEIVSADSRQIYKEMNIGTAKPFCFPVSFPPARHASQGEAGRRKRESSLSLRGARSPLAAERQSNLVIPHHLINIIRPDQDFTLSQYQKLAIKTIKDIQKQGKIPFLVGGTGLYIKSIVDNLKIPQVKPDKKLRQKLEKLTEKQLFQKLKKIDPAVLDFIDPNNKRRLIRALEVCLLTKKPFSQQREKGEELFDVLQIGLKISKEELKKRIEQRTEKMLEAGLVDEVKNLLKKYSPDLPSMSGIGYREIIQYLLSSQKAAPFLSLRGAPPLTGRRSNLASSDLSQAKQLIIQRTYQYAKRQMTWFKKDKRIKWIKNSKEAEKLVRKFID
jgi:tRNA dimethylallyltransferase